MDSSSPLAPNSDLFLPKSDLRSSALTKLRRGIFVAWFRTLVVLMLDVTSIALAWLIALRYGTPISSPWTSGLSVLPLILAVKMTVLTARGLHKAGENRRNYWGVIKALSISEILLLLVAFLYEPDYYVSRSIFLLSWLLSIFLCCTLRLGFDVATSLARERGAVCYPVVLVSDSESQGKLIQLIEQENRYSIQAVNEPNVLDKANRQAFFDQLQKTGIVEVFVSWSAIQNRLHLCWYFQTAGITLRILFAEREPSLPRLQFWMIGKIPSLTVEAPVLVGSEYWLKRGFDLCCAGIAVLLLLPVYLIIAIAIKLDSPGPIFFRQTRVGLHGRKFKVWKFRTMVANAAQLQATLEAQNEMRDGVLFKMKHDPRITRIGRFLRHYSLDELPQLFNVLQSEMSLVGPRPLPVRDVEKFKEGHFIRQEVLPGITGLWQVSGRSDIDNFDDAVKLDITYITNWSIWLDLKIILRTVKVVFRGSGAY
jgi:exopolysaccharide biosynthesis polyprenyl glycosylphosphotransferase